MRLPPASALLDAWEQAMDISPTRRALTLLTVALPNVDGASIARLPIGERDHCLMRFRRALFGDAVQGTVQCPQCGEHLDLSFRLQDIGLNADDDTPDAIASVTAADVREWCDAEYEVQFRLPNSEDLLKISSSADTSQAQLNLLNHCVLSAKRIETGNEAIAPANLPSNVTASLAQAMSEADPLACTELQLNCPACQHAWLALFDIAHFLWIEVHAWARRTLQDVQALARTYGWREQDILAMSARRRRLYLELQRA